MKADKKRINLLNEEDVRKWCETFGCTPTELQAAVQAVGPMALDVEAYLKRRKPADKRRATTLAARALSA